MMTDFDTHLISTGEKVKKNGMKHIKIDWQVAQAFDLICPVQS